MAGHEVRPRCTLHTEYKTPLWMFQLEKAGCTGGILFQAIGPSGLSTTRPSMATLEHASPSDRRMAESAQDQPTILSSRLVHPSPISQALCLPAHTFDTANTCPA